MSYRDVFQRSISDPAGFWGEQAALVDWIRKPTQVLDDRRPPVAYAALLDLLETLTSATLDPFTAVEMATETGS